jgi:molybdate transport system regulatory protein
MSPEAKHKLSFKVWLEYKGEPLLGMGGAEILEQIQRGGSISKAAEKLGMSYRYVWNYLERIEKTLDEPVVQTFRGGKSGGGGTRLTLMGESLLEEYKRLEGHLEEILSEGKRLEVMWLKISARNRLKGKVVAVDKDGLMAKIKLEIMRPAFVTALISREAAEDLEIKVGDDVEAVVKATEVMVAK